MKEVIPVRLDPETIEQLNKIAKRDDLYISQMVRRAVKKYLEADNEKT